MQIIQRIKQNRLFSAIYILGSALSIASVMIVVVFLYVKLADIYPERDRTHVYEITDCKVKTKNGFTSHDVGWYTCDLIEEALGSCEGITAISRGCGKDIYKVHPDDGMKPFEIVRNGVDHNFFDLYDFEILAGNIFSKDDVESGIAKAVISHRLAQRLYGSVDDAVGKPIKIHDVEYKVCGVVREPSFLMQNSFGQAYVPWKVARGNSWNVSWYRIIGPYTIKVRVEDDEAGKRLKETVDDVLRRVDLSGMQGFTDDPELVADVHSLASKDFSMPAEFDWEDLLRKYGFMILILLIVPAVNLGGMISGNMETRMPEMGVRKSFGAGRGRLLRSVLSENFALTSIGAVLGLVIAVVLVWGWKDWIFFLDDSIMADAPESVSVIITADMLFAPLVFAIAFVVTFMLNLFSAMLPVWWSLRNPIVKSLSEKK
ncbi:MAG: ABC transporter permease [Muribaculaceae bacterium]|nr:ABC transporter permease [Muribaculaceae bacterium]